MTAGAGPAHAQARADAAPARGPDPDRVQAAARAAAAACGGPVLALDTSTVAADLVLVTQDAVYGRHLAAQVRPSEAVMPALVALLADAGLAAKQLRALVVGLGPGSFTGLRVGLATLKGLGYAAGVPLYGTSSLAMLAAAAGRGRVAVMRDARRGSAYLGAYDVAADGGATPLGADACLTVDELAPRLAQLRSAGPCVAVGDDATLPAELALAPLPAPRAALLVVQAAARLARGEADDTATLAPAYLQAMHPPRRAG